MFVLHLRKPNSQRHLIKFFLGMLTLPYVVKVLATRVKYPHLNTIIQMRNMRLKQFIRLCRINDRTGINFSCISNSFGWEANMTNIPGVVGGGREEGRMLCQMVALK